MYLHLCFLLIAHVVSFDMPETWINPADMLHSQKFEDVKHSEVPNSADMPHSQNFKDVKHSKVPNTDSTSSGTSACENVTSPAPVPSACDSYLKRMVYLLLNEANLKNYKLPKGDFRVIPLNLHFTSRNLEILHKMISTENLEDIPLSDIDLAFSSLFELSDVKEKTSEKIVSSEQRDYAYFIFLGIVGSLVIISMWLLLTGGSYIKIIFSFSMLSYAFALVSNLIRAYNIEKDKIREMHHNKFKESQSSNSWLDPFRRLMSKSSDTEELPFLPESDPLVNVNFGKVFIETLGTIFDILPILGEKSGKMVSNYTDSQNFLVKWFIIPINLLLNPLLIIVGLLLWSVVRNGFSMSFPFVSFSIGNNQKNSQSQRHIQSQASDEPHSPRKFINTGQSESYQASRRPSERSVAGFEHSPITQFQNIPGPSRGAPIKRIITEFHHDEVITSNSEVTRNSTGKVRDNSGRIPSITVTRKGMVMKRRTKKI